MKEVTIMDDFHHNLRLHHVRSTFVIGKLDLKEGEEIVIRSSKPPHPAVRAKVLKSDTRDLPIFTEKEAEAIAGKDPLFMMHYICRRAPLESLDAGITYIEHSRPQPA
jgi:hypothetical protein